MAPAETDARRAAGFSLIELMAVLVLLGAVAMLAAPMFGDNQLTRLKAAADLLAADLGYAQIESITHADDLRLVVVDVASNSYRIVRSSAPDTPILNPADGLNYEVKFGAGRASQLTGVSILNCTLGGEDRIRFGPYGQLDQTTPATITLTAGGHSITVSIDPVTGEATMGPVG